MNALADIASRPWLVRFALLGVLLAAGAGPLFATLDASGEIDTARLRLDRALEQAARAPAIPPLSAKEGADLLTAFRSRLDALATAQAVVIDRVAIEPDPERPDLPRLQAGLRGTAEALHGLMHALETGTPLLAIEAADLDVERPADPEIRRPTIMRLAFTVRGVLTPPAGPRGAP